LNAVEIEEAVSALFSEPFDPREFPYSFLRAFGNKDATIARLRTGNTNKSDVGGVLQRNNIHLAVAPPGQVAETLAALRESPATVRHKAKFIVATDGVTVEAEELSGHGSLACEWKDFPDHFGMFLPLAGISTVREIRENTFDIRATSKLNKLYVSLLRDNPGWGTDERRPDLNHFFARLIFCYFAEDTGIFADEGLFTRTVTQMSAADSSNTREVIGTLFTAMNTPHNEREAAQLPRWAISFPYVNGGLFSGSMDVPRFSRSARAYLLQVGTLDWKQINPDIFGSMIQAVADDEERGALGMHYTSVPNILKVLNPLFLDDLRAKLEEAGDSSRKLLNLRNRIARIRVFDPACGSGNFLVIAYKEMRRIEHEINRRRREVGRSTDMRLTNFRGIELRDFAAEIARLALVIAEFQCDVLYRGQQEALNDFLPLDADNWITRGNALQLDWPSICPPMGTSVKLAGDDLFSTPLDQPEIDFETAGGETYACGNPPYVGSQDQSATQKADLRLAASQLGITTKAIDYVAGWFCKARQFLSSGSTMFAFVATNSICQGRQVAALWPQLLGNDYEIRFAEPSFPWSNLAAREAAVTVSIVGVGARSSLVKRIVEGETVRSVNHISPYLVPGSSAVVHSSRSVLSRDLTAMTNGSMPNDAGALILSAAEAKELRSRNSAADKFLHRFLGSHDTIQGELRYCVWVDDKDAAEALAISELADRFSRVAEHRTKSDRSETNALAERPFAFGEVRHRDGLALLIPRHSSEGREYLPSEVIRDGIIGDSALAIYGFKPWDIAVLSSRLHAVWIETICGKIKTDFRYSNTLGWNTFPVPTLTEQNKADLSRTAEEILLAREAHYPATLAELYDPKRPMPEDLKRAHERNDEVLERIYIGRRFRNDTERLEKLFEMYTTMIGNDQRLAVGRSSRR